MSDLVAIARVAKPRGLKGELVADLLTDFPERFDGLENVTGVFANGEHRELKIEDAWFQNGRIVLKFEGIDSIETAAHLRPIPSIKLPELIAGSAPDFSVCHFQKARGRIRAALVCRIENFP